jgi:hypothetical protein
VVGRRQENMRNLRITDSGVFGHDERSPSAGIREIGCTGEPTASPRPLQPVERQQEELFTERLLEGFGALLNRKLAEVISRMAAEHFLAGRN